jgi:hypothetical protein
MKTFRCVRCDSPPAGLRQDFFAVQDSSGKGWVCREDEPPHLAGSGWEGWAHYAGVAEVFAALIGETISGNDPFEEVARVMAKTALFEVANESALPGALSAHKD